jgi:hypothetical protein
MMQSSPQAIKAMLQFFQSLTLPAVGTRREFEREIEIEIEIEINRVDKRKKEQLRERARE